MSLGSGEVWARKPLWRKKTFPTTKSIQGLLALNKAAGWTGLQKGAVKVGVTFHFRSLSLLHQMTNLPMCITWKFHKHCPPEIPPSWPFFYNFTYFFITSGPDIHHGQGIWTNLRETLPNKNMWLKQMDAICQLARIVGKGHPKGNKFWEQSRAEGSSWGAETGEILSWDLATWGHWGLNTVTERGD